MVECMVFSGLGGLTMMFLLAAATIASFIGSYYYRRLVRRVESRPPKVFFFDLFKMLVASVVSSMVNYTFTAKVSLAANGVTIRGKPLEGIGWYGAISVMDVTVGAPVSILVGRAINFVCRWVDNKLTMPSPLKDTVHQNRVYGKYSDDHNPDCWYWKGSPLVYWRWWYAQTVTWTCACVISVVASGLLVLYSFILVRSTWNPIAWIAVVLSYWSVNCLLKQWIVVTFGRIILAYFHLAIVDYFNKYADKPTKWK